MQRSASVKQGGLASLATRRGVLVTAAVVVSVFKALVSAAENGMAQLASSTAVLTIALELDIVSREGASVDRVSAAQGVNSTKPSRPH